MAAVPTSASKNDSIRSRMQRRRSTLAGNGFASDESWMIEADAVRHRTTYNPRSSSILNESTSKALTFGSRVPEIKQKKKILYSTQMTSVTRAIYDENWASKQANSFCGWVNHIFSTTLGSTSSLDNLGRSTSSAVATNGPPTVAGGSGRGNGSGTGSGSSSGLSKPFGPTGPAVIDRSTGDQNANALKELMQKRKEGVIHNLAIKIYGNQSIAVGAIEREVFTKTISLREDRDILIDLGLQDSFLKIIFNYELPWVKVGMETIFGEIISLPISPQNKTTSTCQTGCLRWKNALKLFIKDKFFTASRFSSQNSTAGNDSNEIARQHLLKNFFIFVSFLDSAKRKNVLNLPTLFVRDATVKSSRDTILRFYKEQMKGTEDLLRHLSLYGYSVQYEQNAVDEFDFTVTNVLTDFRDGVRLVRLMEVLTQTSELSKYLRVPAVSRLQKQHNVSLALKLLYGAGTLQDPEGYKSSSGGLRAPTESEQVLEAKDIINGHRDRTLRLLWKIVYACKLRTFLARNVISKECSSIVNSERAVYGIDEIQGFAVTVPIKGTDGSVIYPKNNSGEAVLQMSSMSFSSPTKCDDQSTICGDQSTKSKSESDTAVLTTSLLTWCHQIARPYGVYVTNLTSSLSDGRALCLLVHHYHPDILPLRKICRTTISLMETPYNNDMCGGRNQENEEKSEGGNKCFAGSLDRFTESGPVPMGIILSKDEVKKGLEGERTNFITLRSACFSLGGLPMMLPTHDTSDVPEERTMIIFLGYLFHRLMESSSQVRAALKIQQYIRGKKERIRSEIEAIRVSDAAYIIRRRVGTYMQLCKYRRIIHEWRAYKMTELLPNVSGDSGMVDSVDPGSPFDEDEYLRLAFEKEETDVSPSQNGAKCEFDEVLSGDISFLSMNENLSIDFLLNQGEVGSDVEEEKLNAIEVSIIERESEREILMAELAKDVRLAVEEERRAALQAAGTLGQLLELEEKIRQCSIVAEVGNENEMMGNKGTDEEVQSSLEEGEESIFLYRQMNINYAKKIIQRFISNVLDIRSQRRVRQLSAVHVIDRWFLSRLPLVRFRRFIRGMKRLQAFYIGSKVRANSGSKIHFILTRIKAAHKNALADPSMLMGEQTREAIKHLQTNKKIPQLLEACQTLDLATKLSTKCSEAVANAGVARILFTLIRSCNRTAPHQDLLRYSLIVLLNVARYERLAVIIADSKDGADTLVDLMQMFRDKPIIFGKAAELLSRLICASDDVKGLCNKAEYTQRLNGILHILDRKNRLEEKVKQMQKLSPLASNPSSSRFLKIEEAESTVVGNSYCNVEDSTYSMSVRKGGLVLKFLALEDPLFCIQHIMNTLKL